MKRPPATIQDLNPADYNPRAMKDKARKELKNSLRVFGDLSGFVWNESTGNIVCGHQRREVLEVKNLIVWGRPFTVTLGYQGKRFKSKEWLGTVKDSSGVKFAIRRVCWDLAFEKAANVSANNPRIQGEFIAEDLADLLEEIQAETPGEAEDVGLSSLFDSLTKKKGKDADITSGKEQWVILVDCKDEKHQAKLLDKFEKEGLKCRALIS